MSARIVFMLAVAAASSSCVSGASLKARSEVIHADLDRARRSGAIRCAPKELATGEANLEFAAGELEQGNSVRAGQHVRDAEIATQKALQLSKDCGPKQVLVREQPKVVVRIEENDLDGDGVFDKDDGCPNEPGPKENKGCPWPDRDGDGIADKDDKCPDEPGPKEEQGCPKKYKLVVVTKEAIKIKQQIKFASGNAQIIGAISEQLLDEVGQALKDNVQIKKIRIEGHTDSDGPDDFNMKLSQRRADSVMSALIKRGVDPGRMEAVGFGETRPIASNATKAGKAENRRTEFNIVDQ